MTDIDSIRKEIDERYRLIFESYISRINAVYEQVNAVERETFLNNLERVVDSIEIGSFPLIIHGEITFDCRKAIAIRKEAGFLNAGELARHLTDGKAENSLYRTITRYEKGILKKPHRNGLGAKYFGWLKDHGYNPHNF